MIINCNFTIGSAIYLSGNVYQCEITITNTQNPTTIDEVFESHMDGKTRSDVEVFTVRNQPLSFFPNNLADVFPNLRSINFLGSNVSSISSNDLKPFPELLVFSVADNKITTIDGDLFIHNSKLKYINLTSNQIRHIGFNLLSYLKDLERVDFRMNPRIDEVAHNRSEIDNLNDQLPILCPF